MDSLIQTSAPESHPGAIALYTGIQIFNCNNQFLDVVRADTQQEGIVGIQYIVELVALTRLPRLLTHQACHEDAIKKK